MGNNVSFFCNNGPNKFRLTNQCVDYLVIGGIVLADDLLHKSIEAIIEVHKLLHCCAGQKLKNRDEVCGVAAAHHLDKLITDIHQAEQLLVIVVVASTQ